MPVTAEMWRCSRIVSHAELFVAGAETLRSEAAHD